MTPHEGISTSVQFSWVYSITSQMPRRRRPQGSGFPFLSFINSRSRSLFHCGLPSTLTSSCVYNYSEILVPPSSSWRRSRGSRTVQEGIRLKSVFSLPFSWTYYFRSLQCIVSSCLFSFTTRPSLSFRFSLISRVRQRNFN